MSAEVRDALERFVLRGMAGANAGDAVTRFVTVTKKGELRIGDRVLSPGAGLWVAALGKAAPPMFSALREMVPDRIRGGIAIAPEGHFTAPTIGVTQVEAGHPIPNREGEKAARALLDLAGRIPPDDVLVVLLSGGASSLTTCPAEGLMLEDLQRANQILLNSGAGIAEVNSVRKHCSCFSGGRLAAASGTRMIEVLAVSDVRGDQPEVIGSGPCSADATTFVDALAVVERYELMGEMPARVMAHLESGAEGGMEESLSSTDPRLADVHYQIIARNRDARRAVCTAAEEEGFDAVDLGEILQGESSQIGRRLAALSGSLRVSRPTLLVAGGETVVKVAGKGRGGRNQELALAAAMTWAAEGGGGTAALMAVGTDGRDGPTPAAGAFADHSTVARGRLKGLDASLMLDQNDSYTFFSSIGDEVMTGPTGTNVMDLAVVLVREDVA